MISHSRPWTRLPGLGGDGGYTEAAPIAAEQQFIVFQDAWTYHFGIWAAKSHLLEIDVAAVGKVILLHSYSSMILQRAKRLQPVNQGMGPFLRIPTIQRIGLACPLLDIVLDKTDVRLPLWKVPDPPPAGAGPGYPHGYRCSLFYSSILMCKETPYLSELHPIC